MSLFCYEFFAGGGLARLGLGRDWNCLMANDVSEKKAAAYAANFGDGPLLVRDIRTLSPEDLPGRAHLAWASFPCQDLSLAGRGQGLQGERSSTFWPFWELMRALQDQGREVPVAVIENVAGAITSNGGEDFRAILTAMSRAGYRFGPMVLDGRWFTPQSRPRLFIAATTAPADGLASDGPLPHCHPESLRRARAGLPAEVRRNWIWWSLPEPPRRTTNLADILKDADATAWDPPEKTRRLVEMMAPGHRLNVERALEESRATGRIVAGTLYKRTRKGPDGRSVQRAEVRFDGVCGCLRTPAGGSSRQTLVAAVDGELRSRLLTPRETARLMGAPDGYLLPKRANESYQLMGDGVVVPLVAWLERQLLRPLVERAQERAS
ncbi:MAG: DNA cytosine methyltransferase [Desulfovibrionaceae bacterium]